MKKEEFNEGMNHLDPEIIEQYSLQKDNLRRTKKLRGTWLRFGSVAACFAVIAGTIIAFPRLREFNLGPDIGTETTKATPTSSQSNALESTRLPEADPSYSVTPTESVYIPNEGDHLLPTATKDQDSDNDIESPGDETVPKHTEQANETEYVPEVDSCEVAPETALTPDYAFTVDILDPKFTGYEMSGAMCDFSSVGDYFSDITLTFGYGPEKAEVLAKAYTVKDMDSNLCLCVSYVDDGTDFFYNNVLVSEAYYFIYAKSYSFDSLGALRDALPSSELSIPDYVIYHNNKNGTVTNSYLNKNVVNVLKSTLLSIDGAKVPFVNGTIKAIEDESMWYLSIPGGFSGEIGYYFGGIIIIYDSGYLYYSAFGGQLFEIGEENARTIIEMVTSTSTPESYEWIESEGKLFPVIYDEDAEYAGFSEMLIENKLYDQLYFEQDIVFWKQVYGASHADINIRVKYLEEIANLLYAADGPAVKNAEIPGFSPEENLFHPVSAVVLTQLWENGDRTEISIYDCGHVELNGHYYFIGTEFTDKIFYIINHCIGDSVESDIPSETSPHLSAESSCDLPLETSPSVG